MRRSGTVTGLVIALLVLGALFAEFENHKGNYTKIKRHLATPAEQDTSLRPGGADPIVLTRSATPGSMMPEFTSVTLLPGRGMDVLRITASLPDKGEVDLLAGGGLDDATKAMTGTADDSGGEANLTHGAAILVPWAGRLGGIPAMDGGSVTATWRGKIVDLPANRVETSAPAAFGGLLSKAVATNVEVTPMPDGGSATAVFEGGDDPRWPSKTETTVAVLMSSRALDLTVTVKNTGAEPTPVGVGWAPRFLIPSGNRAKATLRLPATMHAEVRDAASGLPTGKQDPVEGTRYDFNARNGVALGTMSLNDTFLHLRARFDDNPTVELRDAGSRMGLRVIALSPDIKAIHVFSPADADFVSISPQTNYDDPFGREWGEKEDTGMTVLAPGQTVQWKVRVELFPLMSSTPAPM